MIASLALLAVFLTLWLRQAYGQELQAVRKEGNVLFINSVRALEGEFMEKVYREPVSLHRMVPADSLRIKVSGRPKVKLFHTRPDTAVRIVQVFGDRRQVVERDSEQQFDVFIKTEQSGADVRGDEGGRFVGSLALMHALSEGRSPAPDSLMQVSSDHRLPVLIEARFSEQVQNAGLPFEYRIVRYSDSTAQLEPRGFRSDVYVDISTGDRFTAEFSGVHGYVWRRLLPQLGFAALLYGCVALAFFTVHRNLQRQRRLTALKNDFINNVTHELKTPIATVSVAVEALRSFNAMHNPARAGEYLDIAKNELNRLSILVDKVLKMSLFEHTRAELKPEPIDLKALIEEVLQSLRLQFEKTGAHVEFEAEGLNFVLQGDRLHLTSVIYNLLDNALKYGGEDPEIQVGLAQADGMLRVEVRDRGIGIPDAYRDKIFDKFFRVPHGNVHDTRGHGLGLHYVANVVRQHLGSIRAERNPGGAGTCFTVMLPQA
jgi:signal transduction histidine kinase